MKVELKFDKPIIDDNTDGVDISDPPFFISKPSVKQDVSVNFRDAMGNIYISHHFSVQAKNSDLNKAFLHCLEMILAGEVNWEIPKLYDVDVKLSPETEFTLNLDFIPGGLKEIYQQMFNDLFNRSQWNQFVKCIPMSVGECAFHSR